MNGLKREHESSSSQDGSKTPETEYDSHVDSIEDIHSLASKRKKLNEKKENLEDLTLLKTSAFELKLNELIREISVRGKYFRHANTFVEKIKDLIFKTPVLPETNFWSACKNLEKDKKVIVPLAEPLPAKDTNLRASFVPPKTVTPGIFSCSNKFFLNPDGWSYDLFLEIPESIFTQKDYLNGRYFHKRAFYLTCIAKHLLENLGNEVKLEFVAFNDDIRRPILAILPESKGFAATGKRFTVFLIPTVRQIFPVSKLLPHKNAIRDFMEHEELKPTPFYNNSVLEEQNLLFYRDLVKKYSVNPQFLDACGLGSTWLNMRGFSSSIHSNGFGLLEWYVLMALLMSSTGLPAGNVLNTYLTAAQFFKSMLQFLSSKNLTSTLFKLNADSSNLKIGNGHLPTLIDCNTGFNLLGKMKQSFFEYFQASCRHTLNLLDENANYNFPKIFITRVNVPALEFDVSGCIPLEPKELEDPNFCRKTDLDSPYSLYLEYTWDLLQHALGDRVCQIILYSSICTSCSINESLKTKLPKRISFGLLLNPDALLRLVDIGPSPDDTVGSQKFREFWGEVSELRKFKNGSIAESVYWECSSPDERIRIPQRIIRHILNRHLGNNVGDRVSFRNEKFRVYVHSKISPNTDTYNEYVPVMEAYNEAVKSLINLSDIPLSIAEILPADESLRYSSSSVPFYESSTCAPIDVVFQFESSSKWPDELEGIQRTKIAFLLKIAELLEALDNVERASVGLENTDNPTHNCCFLQVLFSNNFTFRYRLRNDREIFFWKSLERNPSIKLSAQKGLYAYEHMFQFIPRHTLAIQAICQAHRSYSMAVRLAKHWFYSHLLTDHVTDEVIELLVASVYINSSSWRTTSSGETAFCRMLHFLAHWDWRFDPLIINSNGKLPHDVRHQATEKLESIRKQDVAIAHNAYYIITDYDFDGNHIGYYKPSKIIANRITSLARASLSELLKDTPNYKSIFKSSLDIYHVVIDVNINKLPMYRESNLTKYKNLQNMSSERPGFEPITEFVKELHRCFEDTISFFYNKKNPKVVTGVFNPRILANRPYRTNIDYPFKVVDKDTVVLDADVVCEEIRQVGGDLIRSIQLQLKA
ncbi:U3 small nucleolar RNA-associated protein 22-like [Schizosaccharomyces pombe]